VVAACHGYVFAQDPSLENFERVAGGDVRHGQDPNIDAPGRIMVPDTEWLKVWHDEKEDGTKLVRFGIVFGKAAPLRESRLLEKKDPEGHEHKGKGPGGGQFVKGGGSGAESEKTAKKEPKQAEKPEPKANKKGAAKPAHHPGAAHGSEVKVTPTKKMAAPRNAKGQIDPVQTKTVLSKQETGRVVESTMRAYLRDVVGIEDTVGLNSGKPNESIDLFGDSMAPEVKGGMCNVSKGAQQWRITFSMELGKAEAEQYSKMSEEQQKAWREKKQRDCLKRKTELLKKISKKHGKEIKAVTFTGIVNPDTQTVDIYKTDGYHQRIGWNDPKAEYVASMRYDHAD